MPTLRIPLLLLVLVAAASSTGCGPIVLIPGGELSGEVVAAPHDWKFTDAIDTVQLETRPHDPYSVNVWAVAVGDELFVATGETAWAAHLAQDPRVRLRVDGKIYELRATRSDSAADRDAVLAAMRRKYDFEPDPGETSDAAIYRLAPR